MKMVLNAENVVWATLDNCEACKDIMKDYATIRGALAAEADAIAAMVTEELNDPERNPNMTSAILDEHLIAQKKGEGIVWELDGKRASDILAFLPVLRLMVFKELFDRLQHD